MIELKNDALVISFPEVHRDATAKMSFQRTLRIPDDGHEYPLPPGLGKFPLHHVDDFLEKIPEKWISDGGVFIPMYQSEAMWINFNGNYPMAIKIAAGKINAVSGSKWNNTLAVPTDGAQDYLVVPDQPWLDGFNVSDDRVRQFVATPLGGGHTVEEQLTGKADIGGIQIIAYPMKRERYLDLTESRLDEDLYNYHLTPKACISVGMGLGVGGLMKQRIYEDVYGIDAWDTAVCSRCFVHIANSHQYHSITGSMPPAVPPDAAKYNEAGLPWFDVYDDHLEKLQGAANLADVGTVPETPIQPFEPPIQPRRFTPGRTFKIQL